MLRILQVIGLLPSLVIGLLTVLYALWLVIRQCIAWIVGKGRVLMSTPLKAPMLKQTITITCWQSGVRTAIRMIPRCVGSTGTTMTGTSATSTKNTG